ncbi:hypothetical protein Cgig2_025088 [Carnegiea gigantea]|uniref:GPI ethanolamine phosphate transferase 3 n=1 Tax=Carnegiea gigantea TaxID=171969 RepID=A0A9Q1QJ27_9CARY|nr:hypothetical protein Cgig2_025088 [Carnegiea gigantea]
MWNDNSLTKRCHHVLPLVEKKPWMDKLQVIQEVAAEAGSSSRIFKAIADPPTTSLQRLKGLTTGGLPTFVDVGNSFGAPAIGEDNFIQQVYLFHFLVENGKRVVMMGDDTWLQLFPHHFNKSFPYPSFNVKDLDTVDNGCVEHLLPSLYEGNWDVLIAHFLGVDTGLVLLIFSAMVRIRYTDSAGSGREDPFGELPCYACVRLDVTEQNFLEDHAGHIFGVDTKPMIQKLEQYNGIVKPSLLKPFNFWCCILCCQEVVEVLKSQSGPGGLHENTFLVVMGDHAQTLNGDHGGGSPEEVCHVPYCWVYSGQVEPELAKLKAQFVSSNSGSSSACDFVSSLDFAATMSAMLGVPFPFGSIGRVNPQLYSLAAGGLLSEGVKTKSANEIEGHQNHPAVVRWMQHYVNVLCINAWQVKQYIDVYSASSVIGFSSEDLSDVADIYSEAENSWLHVVKDSLSCTDESCASLPALRKQIGIYLQFIESVIGLARSKWTVFDLKLMVIGLSVIFLSLLVQLFAIGRANKFFGSSVSARSIKPSVGLIFAIFVILVRASSFLSNSFIMEEGKVAIFFLGTAAILVLRYTVMKAKMLSEATSLVILVCALRFVMEFGLSKEVANSLNLASMLGIPQDHPFWVALSFIFPMLALFSLAYMLYRSISGSPWPSVEKYVILGTILCYVLISVHWVLESEFSFSRAFHYVGRIFIPRMIYAIGIAQLVLLGIGQLVHGKRTSHYQKVLTIRTVAMISVWSSTIILLLGKQGSFVALASIGAAWCITRSENLDQAADGGTTTSLTFYPLPVTQWSLLAVALFFCTGHWCAFDGLRYGAAFVGWVSFLFQLFDEFMLIRQAILLTIDTFGCSHLLPIFGLPLLVSQRQLNGQPKHSKLHIAAQLCQVN